MNTLVLRAPSRLTFILDSLCCRFYSIPRNLHRSAILYFKLSISSQTICLFLILGRACWHPLAVGCLILSFSKWDCYNIKKQL